MFIYYLSEKFNVLWRDNWTIAAGKVLNDFENQVIKKIQFEGYSGGDDKQTVQWSFSGALLYSVTVITTIGKSFLKREHSSWSLFCTVFLFDIVLVIFVVNHHINVYERILFFLF